MTYNTYPLHSCNRCNTPNDCTFDQNPSAGKMPGAQDHFFFLFGLAAVSSLLLFLRGGLPSSDSALAFGDFLEVLPSFFGFLLLIFRSFVPLPPRLLLLGLKLLSKAKQTGGLGFRV